MPNTSLPNFKEEGEAESGLSFDNIQTANIWISAKLFFSKNRICGECHKTDDLNLFYFTYLTEPVIVARCQNCRFYADTHLIKLTNKDIFTFRIIHGV